MSRKLVPTPTECGCARGCVYSIETRRPRFCEGCRVVQYEERKRRQRAVYHADPAAKKQASKDAYRRAHPVEAMVEAKKERARLREIERQSRPNQPRIRAPRAAGAPKTMTQKRVREIEAKVKPTRARKQAPRPTTHSSILALWSRAHDNSPLRLKYPTKDALKRAGLQPGYRRETVNT